MKTKAWLLISIFFLVSISIAFVVNGEESLPMYVESQTGELTNYTVKILLLNESGASNDNIIYTNYLSNPDFSDIRFTNETGTPLSHYITTYEEDSWAYVWVKLPSISTSGTNFTAYYGNNSLSGRGNGTNTFLYFFEASNETCDDIYGNTGWYVFDCNSTTFPYSVKFGGQTDGGWPHSGVNKWRRKYYELPSNVTIDTNISIGMGVNHDTSNPTYQSKTMPFWLGLSDDNRTAVDLSPEQAYLGVNLEGLTDGSSIARALLYDFTNDVTYYGTNQSLTMDEWYEVENKIVGNTMTSSIYNATNTTTGDLDISGADISEYPYIVIAWREKIDSGLTMDRPMHTAFVGPIFIRHVEDDEPIIDNLVNLSADFNYTFISSSHTNFKRSYFNGTTYTEYYYKYQFNDTSVAENINITFWNWDLGPYKTDDRNLTYNFTINWDNTDDTSIVIPITLTIENESTGREAYITKYITINKYATDEPIPLQLPTELILVLIVVLILIVSTISVINIMIGVMNKPFRWKK